MTYKLNTTERTGCDTVRLAIARVHTHGLPHQPRRTQWSPTTTSPRPPSCATPRHRISASGAARPSSGWLQPEPDGADDGPAPGQCPIPPRGRQAGGHATRRPAPRGPLAWRASADGWPSHPRARAASRSQLGPPTTYPRRQSQTPTTSHPWPRYLSPSSPTVSPQEEPSFPQSQSSSSTALSRN